MRAAWLIIFLVGVAAAAEPLVGIGHIPIAVRDLDSASADYRALGFTLKPGQLHDDSILNNHAKFADGTELELITATQPRDALATKYLQLMAVGDGPAFLALEWTDVETLRAALKRANVGFEEGAYFTLRDPRLAYLFFGGNNRSPTDRPEHFVHANTADALVGVWIADAENDALRELLHAVGARLSERRVQLPRPQQATVAELANGAITLLPKSQRLIADRPIIGAVLLTNDLAQVAASARKSGVADVRAATGPGYHSLILPPSATHGLWLEFRQVDMSDTPHL